MSGKISEQAVLFGSRASLVGVVASGLSAASADCPAIIVLNTGIIHRVGHHRMFVTMSRALAAIGCTVLRFDFSGIGDSDPRDDGLSPEDACMADIKDALDWMERERKASRIILVGLCSGADNAILYGQTDPRITGLVLMDPLVPPTARYYMHNIASRLGQLQSWFNVLSGRSRAVRMFMRKVPPILQSGWKARRRLLPNPNSRRTLERRYQKLVENGTKILAIFTAETTRQTYREQMIDALPNVSFGDLLKLEFFPGSNHTFMLGSDRSRLIQLILEWVGELKRQPDPAVRSEARSARGEPVQSYGREPPSHGGGHAERFA